MDNNLLCPSCNNLLVTIKVRDIFVDVCKDGCGGIWFDKDEMKRVDEKQEAADDFLSVNQVDKSSIKQNQTRKCPRCGIDMYEHFSSVKMKIKVDECQKCGGIWLDAAELDAIRNEYENDAERNADAAKYFADYSEILSEYQEKENAERNKTLQDKIFGGLYPVIADIMDSVSPGSGKKSGY